MNVGGFMSKVSNVITMLELLQYGKNIVLMNFLMSLKYQKG